MANMNGTPRKTCFFSFGPDSSFISNSYEGLRYHDLPTTLQALIAGGNVLDVHWATLGPIRDAWVLSFNDSSGQNNLAWGPSIPSRLEKVLCKLAPSPHLRVFLGPGESYVAWDPTFIRWADLPVRLEDALQSWLTPAGWREGPPRMMSWGVEDAFFAMSEYGEVSYRFGGRNKDEWPIWRETVDEWRAEKGFRWTEIAYIAIDATTSDQFVAIRKDGTWSGSIDDANSDALTAFAHNFFRLASPKSNPGSSSRMHANENGFLNGGSGAEAHVADPATEALYKQWSTSTAQLFASALAVTAPTSPKRAPKKLQIRSQSSPSAVPASTPSPNPSIHVPQANLLTSFPYLPPAITTCSRPVCALHKADPSGLRACKHDVERLLRASGSYGYEWLRQERLRWHPDRFGRLCSEEWRDEGRKLAEEMFKIVDILIGELEAKR